MMVVDSGTTVTYYGTVVVMKGHGRGDVIAFYDGEKENNANNLNVHYINQILSLLLSKSVIGISFILKSDF